LLPKDVHFERIRPELAPLLAAFFAELRDGGDARRFHPHGLDAEDARQIAHYRGEDEYLALTRGGAVIGYGMLRGWDDGFDVPSLGIALAPSARGHGLGRELMGLLHGVARAHGAVAVRLKVYPDNIIALRLYESLGYEFSGEDDGQLVGTLALSTGGRDETGTA
jgi:ribosomal protein S18 acetylase RimI-like enzyme